MRRMDAGRTYLLYSASCGVLFLLTFTIYSVFAITRLGVDPLQLVLLGSVLELSYLLAEVLIDLESDELLRLQAIDVLRRSLGKGT